MAAYKDERYDVWRFRKWVQRPDGKRIRVTGTPALNTKVAAEAAERQAIERIQHPDRFPTLRVEAEGKVVPTLKEFAERYLLEYLPRCKPDHRRGRKQILEGSLIPFFGSVRLDEIDQPAVNRYVASLKVANGTINNRLMCLSTVLKYAGPEGCRLIPETTLRFHIKDVAAEMLALPGPDVAKLLDAAKALGDARWVVAVLLASEAGLRIGEIRGAQHTDVKDGHITIRRAIGVRGHLGTPKHGKQRVVPLSPALKQALAELPRKGIWILSTDDGSWFRYWTANDRIKKIYARAGVEVPKNENGSGMPFHCLRHSFGSECAGRGMPIPLLMKVMGHEDSKTTMKYVTVTGSQLEIAMQKVFGSQVATDHDDTETSTR